MASKKLFRHFLKEICISLWSASPADSFDIKTSKSILSWDTAFKGSTHILRAWDFEHFGTAKNVPTIFRKPHDLTLFSSQDITSWMFKMRNQRDQVATEWCYKLIVGAPIPSIAITMFFWLFWYHSFTYFFHCGSLISYSIFPKIWFFSSAPKALQNIATHSCRQQNSWQKRAPLSTALNLSILLAPKLTMLQNDEMSFQKGSNFKSLRNFSS